MIKAKNLNFSYDKDKTFINNLNVEIEKGKVTTILGPNGSGKSTLLSIFAGLNKPSSGDVTIKTKGISTRNCNCSSTKYCTEWYYSKRVGLLWKNTSQKVFPRK